MQPSKYDIADWILDGRLPKDLSKNEAWAYDLMRYPLPTEKDKFTYLNAVVMLEAITEKGYCPVLAYDDEGYWAVSLCGCQAATPKPLSIQAEFSEDGAMWYETIPEAVFSCVADIIKSHSI
jgi:hypothetical protein